MSEPASAPLQAVAEVARRARVGAITRCPRVALLTMLAAALVSSCTSSAAVRQPARPADAAGAERTPVRASDRERAELFARQMAEKRQTDAVFAAALGREMIVRKIAYPGADGLVIPAYLFAPRDTTALRPAILFVHGGIHSHFGLVHLQQVRSLIRQGYVVVAPEYRGSTGYGEQFYAAIDYGGKEVDDVVAARDFLERQVPYADLDRLAIMGYSHGGYIALLAVLRFPDWFRAAVAHVPVADLPTRMRTHPAWYQDLFAAQPAYGARLEQNPAPYIQRSPSTHARKLRVPVLVHTADNDDDVFIAENHILRDSMIAAGKDTAGLYTYREWHNPPGGHSFGVMDTPEGRESWGETLAFLARHLRSAQGERAGREPTVSEWVAWGCVPARCGGPRTGAPPR